MGSKAGASALVGFHSRSVDAIHGCAECLSPGAVRGTGEAQRGCPVPRFRVLVIQSLTFTQISLSLREKSYLKRGKDST